MSKPQRMLISCSGGVLVPKPPGRGFFPKDQRFYNFALVEGRLKPQVISGMEVPCDDWHLSLCYDGTCECDGPEEAVRMVDNVRRDRQLQKEAKAGWHIMHPDKLKKPPKKTESKKADKPKDDKLNG